MNNSSIYNLIIILIFEIIIISFSKKHKSEIVKRRKLRKINYQRNYVKFLYYDTLI